jgi:hypothetical protein
LFAFGVTILQVQRTASPFSISARSKRLQNGSPARGASKRQPEQALLCKITSFEVACCYCTHFERSSFFAASDRLRKAAMKILNKSTKEEAKSQWTSVLQLIKVHSVHFRMQKQVKTSSHFSLQPNALLI